MPYKQCESTSNDRELGNANKEGHDLAFPDPDPDPYPPFLPRFGLPSSPVHSPVYILVVVLLTLDEDYMARLETVSIKLNYCFIVGLITVSAQECG